MCTCTWTKTKKFEDFLLSCVLTAIHILSSFKISKMCLHKHSRIWSSYKFFQICLCDLINFVKCACQKIPAPVDNYFLRVFGVWGLNCFGYFGVIKKYLWYMRFMVIRIYKILSKIMKLLLIGHNSRGKKDRFKKCVGREKRTITFYSHLMSRLIIIYIKFE